MSDSDVGDQQMLITVLTNFQNFVDVPFISTCGCYPVHERFPLSSSSSFAFNHPGQCNGFQLILFPNMTHKSDLPANNHLQEIPWRVGFLKNLIIRHFISPCYTQIYENKFTVESDGLHCREEERSLAGENWTLWREIPLKRCLD